MHKKPLIKSGVALLLVSTLMVGLLMGCGGGTTTVTESATDLIVYGDMVSQTGCLGMTVGHRGELVVWRARVVDPSTGDYMTDEQLEGVKALLPDGQEFNFRYGGHPGGANPTDYFWAGAWEIPLNYPTGSLGYEVKATAKDGRTGSFKPFEVASSLFQIKEFDVAFVARKSTNLSATGFSATAIVASQGAAFVINNRDTVDHTVTFSQSPFSDGTTTTGVIAAGQNFTKVLDTPGTYTFQDSANPAFSGTITVNSPVE